MAEVTLSTVEPPLLNWGSDAARQVKGLRSYAESLENHTYFAGGHLLRHLADEIEKQFPKPRIPEPVAFDAAVEAHTHQPLTGPTRRRFVRVHGRGSGYSWVDHTGMHRPWDELLDPVLVRPGVDD